MTDNIKENMKTANVNGDNVKVELKPGDVIIFCPYVLYTVHNEMQIWLSRIVSEKYTYPWLHAYNIAQTIN